MSKKQLVYVLGIQSFPKNLRIMKNSDLELFKLEWPKINKINLQEFPRDIYAMSLCNKKYYHDHKIKIFEIRTLRLN